MKTLWQVKFRLLVRSICAAVPGHFVMDLWAWMAGLHHYPLYSWQWWARTLGLAAGLLLFFVIETWAENGKKRA